MRFFHRGRRALAAMTNYAAHMVRRVRNHWMPPERLGADIDEAGLFQAHMASGAAIDHPEFRQPDLLNSSLKMSLQRDCFSASPNQAQIVLLVMPPFAEV